MRNNLIHSWSTILIIINYVILYLESISHIIDENNNQIHLCYIDSYLHETMGSIIQLESSTNYHTFHLSNVSPWLKRINN